MDIKPMSKETIQFKFHPRLFAALGTELVTNDLVAILELVKNSYDAYANEVVVRIYQETIGQKENQIIEIFDDGQGMTRDVIENVWCVVATPYKLENPIQMYQGNSRRVSGDKGLGRLSASRLGSQFSLMTKTINNESWIVEVDWDKLANGAKDDSSEIEIYQSTNEIFPKGHGTLIRITSLRDDWDDEKIGDLKDQLARLISPFSKMDDFTIRLSNSANDEGHSIEVKPHLFLSKPPYMIKGNISEDGKMDAVFTSNSESTPKNRIIKELVWEQVDEKTQLPLFDDGQSQLNNPTCGPFSFEIRVWDLDVDSILELSNRFNLDKKTIRNDIRNYRGISLYRDRILVLPKSDTARDWLGIDLRRVSKVGTRLSTSQIVGYISITAEKNKKIKETSDRERLEENKAFKDFKKLISKILSILEYERDKVRKNASHKEPPLKDLFTQLSTAPLMESIYSAIKKGAKTPDIINLVEDYGNQVEKTVEIIENRLFYYSRLASLGILAAILVHEVRNQTLIIDRFLRRIKKTLNKPEIDDKDSIEGELRLAEKGLTSLDSLANRFAPLARRSLSNRNKSSIIEEIIDDCVQMRIQEIEQKSIKISIPLSKTEVLVDPGELTAIFINLIDNSIYWLGFIKNTERLLEFTLTINKVIRKVNIQVNDNGPGIIPGDEERIFWPGVTRKEDGFGMGLTVASEIISQYGGKMSLVVPGYRNGASFQFDLPLSDKGGKHE